MILLVCIFTNDFWDPQSWVGERLKMRREWVNVWGQTHSGGFSILHLWLCNHTMTSSLFNHAQDICAASASAGIFGIYCGASGSFPHLPKLFPLAGESGDHVFGQWSPRLIIVTVLLHVMSNIDWVSKHKHYRKLKATIYPRKHISPSSNKIH